MRACQFHDLIPIYLPSIELGVGSGRVRREYLRALCKYQVGTGTPDAIIVHFVTIIAMHACQGRQLISRRFMSHRLGLLTYLRTLEYPILDLTF